MVDDEMKQLEKEESKLAKSIKNLIPNLKKNNTMDSKIKESIKKYTQKAKVGGNAVKKSTLKVGSSILAGMMKTPAFIITLWGFLTVGPAYIPFLYAAVSMMIAYFTFLDPTSAARISFIISSSVVITILLYLFPWAGIDAENRTAGKLWEIVFIVVCLMMFWSLLTYGGSKSNSEVISETLADAGTNGKNLWEEVSCYMSTDCIMAKQAQEKAQTIKTANYEIKFQTPLTIKKTLEKTKERPITLQYLIASSGDMKITGFKCYHTKIDSNNLFYEEDNLDYDVLDTSYEVPDAENGGMKTQTDEVVFSKLKCNMENFEYMNKKEVEEVTIISQIQIEVDTNVIIKLPIISQEKYYEERGIYSDEDLPYPSRATKLYLDKSREVNFEVLRSTDAVDIDVGLLKESMPMIFGNNEEYELEMPIVIKENNINSFGKLVNIETINAISVPKIFKQEDTQEFEETTKEGYFIKDLILVEDEGQAENLPLPLTSHEISFKIKTTLKKDDNFKITIEDKEWEEKLKTEEEEAKTQEEIDADASTDADAPLEITSPVSELEKRFLNLETEFNKLSENNFDLQNSYLELDTKEDEIEANIDQIKLESNEYTNEEYKIKLDTLENDLNLFNDMITEKLRSELEAD